MKKNGIIKNMKKLLQFLIIAILSFSVVQSFIPLAHADPPDEVDQQETYIRGKVIQITNQGMQIFDKTKSYNENLKVQLLEGNQKNKVVAISYSGDETFGVKQRIYIGDTVVVDSKPDMNTKKIFYTVYEPYRLNDFWWVLAGFVLLIIGVAGKKGIGALLGLTISILTIGLYVVPNIIQGQDPLSVCITGSIIILLLTTYVAHGISIKTTIAVIGTGLSLWIAALIASGSVQFLHLFGLGNEDVQNIQIGTNHPINPQGLLLGSILIGTLGALNDITTTQSIAIFTLAKENPTQHFLHLFKKGMIIGREHIASLVNTLVLAYTGTSMAIFIFFELNPAQLPWWVILNNETTMEEIMRTLIGSAALIIAVPITSFIAAYVALHWTKMWEVMKGIIVN